MKSQTVCRTFQPNVERLEARELLSATPLSQSMRFVGDFNGDRRSDIALVGMDWEGQGGLNVRQLLAKGDGTFTPRNQSLGAPGKTQLADSFAVDVNGDGRTDLAFRYYDGRGLVVRTYVARTNGTFAAPVEGSVHNPSLLFQTSGNSSFPQGQPARYLTGDVNGDGRADLVCFGYQPNQTMATVMTALGQADGTFGRMTDRTTGEYRLNDIPVLADVNGDKRSDLVIAATGRYGILVRTALAQADGTFGRSVQRTVVEQPLMSNTFNFGDFNGDGRADLAIVSPVKTGWYPSGTQVIQRDLGAMVQLALGQTDGSFVLTTKLVVANASRQNVGLRPLIDDVNGDGKADLVFSFTNGAAGDSVVTVYGQARGTLALGAERSLGSNPVHHSGTVFLADVTGDRRADYVLFGTAFDGAVLGVRSYIAQANGTWVGKAQQTGWFDVFDLAYTSPTVRDAARAAFADGSIDRADWLRIFTRVEEDGVVRAAELVDMRSLLQKAAAYRMPAYVQNLAGKVLNGDRANARYRGVALGELYGGTSAAHLARLVSKWFMGGDHPTYDVIPSYYSYCSASLFGSSIQITDVRQGALGSCYLLASLAEVAYKRPDMIRTMFIDNQDGTFTVRFFRGSVPEYVTVDRYLPARNGRFLLADPTKVMWAALAEKAYAQINESGWLERALVRQGNGLDGKNSYEAIGNGASYLALKQITGLTPRSVDANLPGLLTAQRDGRFATVSSRTLRSGEWSLPADITPNHVFAVLWTDGNSVRLYNPWGFTLTVGAATFGQVFTYNFYAGSAPESRVEAPEDPGNFEVSDALFAEPVQATTPVSAAINHLAAIDEVVCELARKQQATTIQAPAPRKALLDLLFSDAGVMGSPA